MTLLEHVKRLVGMGPASGPPSDTTELRQTLKELELSQQPLREVLDDPYPITGTIRRAEYPRKRAKYVARPHKTDSQR